MAYAQNTSVSPERSQEQIKATLRRYGCERFGVMEETNRAFVMFTVSGLNIQIEVPLPAPDDPAFHETPQGRERSASAAWKAYEQAVKQRWRALLLAIKAKLEAVDAGISTIETEFLPFVVLADGQSVSQKVLPHLRRLSEHGRPLSLPLLEGSDE